jgi:urease accessory protein
MQPSAAGEPSIAVEVAAAGAWNRADEVGHVLIDHDRRFRRRFLLQTEQGNQVLLDLPRAVRLRQDDGLVLAGGGVVRVVARAETLTEISAGDSALLLRIAWHLGNRHLPVQFVGDCLRIRSDHVIAAMVEGLGGTARPVQAPFDPEPGAYDAASGAHHHAHDD